MKKKSLKHRLIRLQLILTMIVLVISWTFILFDDYYIFRKLSIQNVEMTARILARNLSTCLAFKDQEECKRVLNTLSLEGNTLEAKVVDTENKVISIFQKQEKKNDYKFKLGGDNSNFEYEIEDDIIKSTYPVFDQQNLEGRLFIVQRFDLMETFGKSHAFSFIFIMFGSLFICVALSTRFQKNISDPINIILTTLHQITDSKDYTLRINKKLSIKSFQVNEFRELANSFDHMLEQVEIRDTTLSLHNINLEKMVQEKAEKLVNSAELAALGEMAGGIAHEINNPLTIIKGTNTVMKKMIERDKFEKVKFLELITNIDLTISRIANIIKGMRNISRRGDDDKPTNCCFQEILSDVLSVASEKFNARGIELRKNYSETDLIKKFATNRVQISQVLINLLNNAHDAIFNLEQKWIEISIKFQPDWIYIKITDSGSGIPIEIREKIFQPFYTTKEIGKGTGIGLAISKSMTEKAGGKFYYDEQCSNTSFVVQLPNRVIT